MLGSICISHAQIPNDICETAIHIPNVISDTSFVKIQGNTFGANPEIVVNSCFISISPTVWYFVEADDIATLINIQVTSVDFSAPAINLFHLVTDCNALEHVPLTPNDQECVMGSNGVAMAIGSEIQSGEVYYIAVSSIFSSGGDFELSVNTISVGSKCVTSRNIEITYRSSGGPLTGPFFPGEKIGVCMNVDTFTAVANGCQWFQGIVPVFGNGWKPTSFDANGQPLNATVNGLPMGQLGNGLYQFTLAATWDWFTDVGHHFDHAFYQISDFDVNGRMDICHTLYEANCSDLDGVTGGCCGPCWDDPGEILPPGWFSYGINGTCAIPGPPISKDWGDGNTCGCCMGPWRFCFELEVRDFTDCSIDSTRRDLSIGFFTFADGQIGSWSGGPSNCALDQPVKIILPLCCYVPDTSSAFLTTICSGEIVEINFTEDSVQYWVWTVDVENVTGAHDGYGGPGSMIIDTLVNNDDSNEHVTYTIQGFGDDPCPLLVRSFSVEVVPQISVSLLQDQSTEICEGDTVVITADIAGGEAPFTFEWSTPAGLVSGDSVNATIPGMYSLVLSDITGCAATSDTLNIVVNPNPVVDLGTDTLIVDLQVILDAGNPGAAYLWNTGDTTQTLEANESGLYSVIVTDSLGCSSSDSVYVSIITSVSYEIKKRIRVYPNPNNGVFTITGEIGVPDILQIKVLNSIGSMIYSSVPELMNSGFSRSFDIHKAGKGIYFLQIYLGDQVIEEKMIIQ
ncbi:MAG TPA: T9SS type A sorting domain-containing protein [Saprospiraceae bacterium]|nr:T9SS type A sorting domain-containing protein [Saprospiraceae bacterium]